MTHLVTYTDSNMTLSAKLCVESALKNNVHEASIMQVHGISETQRYKMREILSEPRGCGLWAWKPAIINETLRKLPPNDILIYADAGVEIINNVNYLIEQMDQDVFLFGNTWRHLEWCKMDAMNKLLPNWTDGVMSNDSKQVQASAMIFRNTSSAQVFVHDWLKACQCKELIDDSPSISLNSPGFQEHRHDQALATIIAYKKRLRLHWWPAVYNKTGFGYGFEYQRTGYESDKYPAIFYHHRKRNNEH